MTTFESTLPYDPPTAKEMALRLRSGRLCLDFIATVGEWDGRRFERIVDSEQWLCWLEKAHVVPPPAVTATDLRDMAELRAHTHRIIRAKVAGEPLAAESIAIVNRFALVPPPPPQLSEDGRTLVRPVIQRPDEVLSTIARDLIDLLSGPLSPRLRRCAEPSCEFYFADGSRPGRRLWCTSCGAAAASARYRSRRNPTRASEPARGA